MNYKKLIELKGLEEIPYQKEFLTNEKYINNPKPIVVSIGTSGGKTLTTILKLELFYSNKKNKKEKTIIIPSDKQVLRDNFEEELIKFKPSFSFCISTNKTEFEESIKDKNCNVIVVLPQTLIRNLSLLKKIHTFILDESHQWYFKKTIQNILKITKPKQQYLLTGTPSKFNSHKENFEFLYVPVMEMYELGRVSNVKVEIVSSEYDLSFKDFKGDEVIENKISKYKTSKSVDTIVEPILKMVGGIKKMEKTIIFCRGIEQSEIIFKKLKKIKELKEKILLSHSKNDKNSINFERFRKEINIKILVVVSRGKLGFNFPNLVNVIDFTMGMNIDTMLQMYGRLLRLSQSDKQIWKTYFKIVPKNLEFYYICIVECMLRLTQMEYYSTYKGKINELPITYLKPKIIRNRNKTIISTPKIPFKFDLNYLKKVEEKHGNDFTSIGYTTLDKVRSEYYGSRVMERTHSEIESICKKYKTYKEFRLNEKSLCSYLTKSGLLEKYTSHMKRLFVIKTNDELYSICKKYKLFEEFYKKESNLIQVIRRRGLFEKYTFHMKKTYEKLNLSKTEIKKTCIRYTKMSDFRKNESRLWSYLYKNNNLEKFTSHMVKVNNLPRSKNEIESICKKYKNFKEFRLNEKSLCSYLRKKGLIKEYTLHMERGGNREYY
jgi:superfamily II DNA or RNA helicase